MDEAPQWVGVACQHWGKQKRRIWSGGDWFINRAGQKIRHVDGYARSFLGKLAEERCGSGHRYLVADQCWREVYGGDGLDVQRACPGMPEISFFAVNLHYVFDPDFGLSARQKADLVEISVRSYWRGLEMAKLWLWARLEPIPNQQLGHNPAPLQVPDLPRVNFSTGLQTVANRGMRSATLARVRDCCLDALHRTTLGLPSVGSSG